MQIVNCKNGYTKQATTIIFIVLLCYCSFGQEQNSNRYVHAMSGLKIREKPSIESKAIGKLLYADTVDIVEGKTSSPWLEIDGLKGKFVAIKCKNLEGYVYSGYLSGLPAPSLTQRWVELSDYLDDAFGKTGDQKIIETIDPYDSASTSMAKFQQYDEHIEYYYYGEECSFNEILKVKHITIEEAFLLISRFNGNYRGISLDVPFKYVKGNSYSTDLAVDGYGQYYRSLSVNKNDDGSIIYISICFDAEAGSGCVRAYRDKNSNGIIISNSYSCS